MDQQEHASLMLLINEAIANLRVALHDIESRRYIAAVGALSAVRIACTDARDAACELMDMPPDSPPRVDPRQQGMPL